MATAGSAWSEREVALAVEDYFEMLLAETEGRSYRKSDHRRALIAMLDGRTDPSVERKYQNISAILIEHGIGPIDGYKPLYNYQHRLAEGVQSYIDRHPAVIERLRRFIYEVHAPGTLRLPSRSVIVPAPERARSEPHPRRHPGLLPPGTDFASMDEQNRRLGSEGERFVVDFERHRLLEAGRDDLSRKVDWVSRSTGDGLGYDIVSFDSVSDEERLIEVKTTNQGVRAPFYLSSNELIVSEEHQEEYRLYRVFRFSQGPKLFVLQPPLTSQCDLEPTLYRARF